ncbi:hypothetical protein [Hymenobacter cellulosilyticus]|uniref:Uncharacterized protein n=1 Tax=Hymenobacter cellulosilyticus TaxID=2932248 RepID=A0A8T9Q9X5_9BACT|nr:hypothetical protein [Hymenobacter cellulosilyticus]UOQ73221.1 hypothetical protein MUN79_04420 [Hymenobacter cellulosilyticus]
MPISRLRPLWLLASGLLLPACQQQRYSEPLEAASTYEMPPAADYAEAAPPPRPRIPNPTPGSRKTHSKPCGRLR